MNYYVVILIAVCESADTIFETSEIYVLAENREDAIDKATEYYYKNYIANVDYVFPKCCDKLE